jgi:hypothetical protein
MKSMMIVCAVLAAGATGASADVRDKGTVAIRGDLDAGVARATEGDDDHDPATAVALGVTGSYFVAEGISVGATVRVAYQTEADRSQTGLAFTPTVGYAARIGERAYLWPQAGLALAWARMSVDNFDVSASARIVAAQVYVPVYLAPAEHLLVGIGPAIDKDLMVTIHMDGESEDGTKQTSIGLVGSLVGWF